MNLNDFIAKIPFEEGLSDLSGRENVGVNSARELSRLYSKGAVFGVFEETRLNFVEGIRRSLFKHLRDGKPVASFVREFQEISGPSSDAYIRTVFRTNMNTAYNRGKFRRAKRIPGVVGFEFIATGGLQGDGSTREGHRLCHHLRAPKGHPVWRLFWPPLGYNCRCTVREILLAEAEARGWLDEEGYLKPWHPRLRYDVTVASLQSMGAGPDNPTFGRNPV